VGRGPFSMYDADRMHPTAQRSASSVHPRFGSGRLAVLVWLVWLPVQFQGQGLRVEWLDAWDLSFFDGAARTDRR
jgi:hypothetical protein